MADEREDKFDGMSKAETGTTPPTGERDNRVRQWQCSTSRVAQRHAARGQVLLARACQQN